MTAGDADHRSVRNQVNSGSGAFIAGDNYGRIEAIDPQTKELLAKVTRQAPQLGRLLQESLRRGFIDPEVAWMVAQAAHSINEDVAVTLREASLSLNEGVAVTLREASTRLNRDVANEIADAARSLERASNELDLGSIENVADQVKETADTLAVVVKSLNDATVGIEQAATPFRRFTVSLRTALLIFIAGAVVGAEIYAHLAGH